MITITYTGRQIKCITGSMGLQCESMADPCGPRINILLHRGSGIFGSCGTYAPEAARRLARQLERAADAAEKETGNE